MDPRTFATVSPVTVPASVHQSATLPRDMVYLGGDAVAVMAQKADNRMYLSILRAPAITP
jgi:hypothetical protein